MSFTDFLVGFATTTSHIDSQEKASSLHDEIKELFGEESRPDEITSLLKRFEEAEDKLREYNDLHEDFAGDDRSRTHDEEKLKEALSALRDAHAAIMEELREVEQAYRQVDDLVNEEEELYDLIIHGNFKLGIEMSRDNLKNAAEIVRVMRQGLSDIPDGAGVSGVKEKVKAVDDKLEEYFETEEQRGGKTRRTKPDVRTRKKLQNIKEAIEKRCEELHSAILENMVDLEHALQTLSSIREEEEALRKELNV